MTRPFSSAPISPKRFDRRSFVGGSDARIIMGDDEGALVRLWREKRGEAEPEDLSGNLIVQLGLVTEALNRHWFERNTGQTVECVQHRLRHPVLQWMGATLDGIVTGSRAVFEAKFMLPWSFSEEAAAEKHIAQLQHNMWVINSRLAALSVITGGGKWVEMKISADPPLPAPLINRGKEILALRRERRAPSPLRGRTTAGPHRGSAGVRPMPGRNFRTYFAGAATPTWSMRMPRRSSKPLCRTTPRRPSGTASEPNAQSPAP
jgi:predicted phage-related endonuclease